MRARDVARLAAGRPWATACAALAAGALCIALAAQVLCLPLPASASSEEISAREARLHAIVGAVAVVDSPVCAVDQLEVDFGGTAIGVPEYRDVFLINAGKEQLVVEPTWSCPEFSVGGSGQFVVDAGDSVIMPFRYVPNTAEADTCVFTLGSGCPDIVARGFGTCTDLVASSFSIADSSIFSGQVIGGALSGTMLLTNVRGGIIAPIATLYISTDSVITRSDRPLIGGRIQLDFDVPPDSTAELRLRIPAGVSLPAAQSGPAYVGLIVDDFNAVVECNESNNTAAARITIIPPNAIEKLAAFEERWVNGIDANLWLKYGDPEPKFTTGGPCLETSGVDPGGNATCFSGVWMKEPLEFGPGARLTVRFATNVLGSRRSELGQALRFGLSGGWDPLPPCEGDFGPVVPRLWVSVNTGTAAPEEIIFLADGVGTIIPAFPYPASMDTTCHTLTFLRLTDGKVQIEIDGVVAGMSADAVSLPDPLFLFFDDSSVDIVNVVSEMDLSPGFVTPSALEFPPTQAGDVARLDIDIWNPDSLPLEIDAIDLGPGPFAFTPEFAESLDAGLVLPVGGRIKTDVFFAPFEGGNFDIDGVIIRDGDTLTTFPIRARAIGLDFTWNNPEDYDPREITEGERVRIKAQLGEGVEIDSLLLHFSKGEMLDFLSVPMTRIDDPFTDRARYQGIIPSEMADASGLEFYISAHNGSAVSKFRSAEAPMLLRVRVASLEIEHLPPPGNYGMISLPLAVPPDVNLMSFIRDDLGEDDPSAWRMFTFDRRTQAYEELHANSDYLFRQGEAYWLIKRGALAIDGPEDRISLSTPLDSAFTILLSPGWNMIASPFAMTVAWDSCLIDGVRTPVAEAAGTVSPLIYWEASQSAYLDSPDILWPFQGYWLRNETTEAVTLSVPPIPEGIISTERTLAKRVDEDGWRVRIVASAAGAKDLINVIGASAEAGDGWDPLDRVEPPPGPGEGVALYFPHADWGDRTGRYTADLRPDRASSEWAFDVARATEGDKPAGLVTLQFEGVESIPAEYDVRLTDRVLGREIDLRIGNSYQFAGAQRDAVSSERDCRFAIRVTKRDGGDATASAPGRDHLFANIPNPFNPATVIQYDIAEAGAVRIRVFDVAGALVRSLFDGPHVAGRYQAVWDGKDTRGNDAPSGVYICRLERGPATSSVRMVLLR